MSDILRPVWLRILAALALGLVLQLAVLAPAGWAQQADEQTAVDYADWEATADKAEKELERRSITDGRLDELRDQLAQWRAAFSTAQTANSARIATVKEQIAALGPAPEEGKTEAPEIALRRTDLAGLLVTLQAPGIAAEEAYRRADGLIREIDRMLRERQADQLLQLWPSPANPANWPEAAIGISDTLLRLWDEVTLSWQNRDSRKEFFDNIPLIVVLLFVAMATIVFARRWIEAFADRLQAGDSDAKRRIYGLVASLGQVIFPVIGMAALSIALLATGLTGELTHSIAVLLPILGLTVFGAIWLGARAFPREQGETAVLPLPTERRVEGRFLSAMMGLVVAAEELREVTMGPQAYSDAVTAVASLPIILTGAFLLWRTGRILRLSRDVDGKSYTLTILSLISRGLGFISVAAPLLAVFGYVAAAKAMIFPAIVSLGLVTVLLVVQRLISDMWSVLSPADDAEDAGGLVPVLAGFFLVLLSLPLFALIWGARLADLTELWTRFREGFQMGETTISPTDFLWFALIFALGYMVTRLFQGALKNTILPRTKLDHGAQTAIVSGSGYVGIFLAALVAINATGIDLSSLAIVAGALSVGIGFGLQNIVQNFVSGIILLLERPVSEGDWIEVGGVQGTVRAISVRSTRIQTFDRTMVIVPNGDLVSQRVTNWTRFGLAGRVIVPVGVAFGTDTRKVEKVLREIAEAQPLAILNPPPLVMLQGFGADAMNFEIRIVLRDVNFSGQVRSDINHMIVKRFAEEGIEIPFAQSEITLRNPGEIAQALATLQAQGGAALRPAALGPAPEDGEPRHPPGWWPEDEDERLARNTDQDDADGGDDADADAGAGRGESR
ncbi:MAG: mechanosensitive ion channel family protein [Rhodobacteraceae bacterium]|nr:mechanosensitive ion channel family protein [Paracoccaceae bacterium]